MTITQMNHWGCEAPSNLSTTESSAVTTEGDSSIAVKSAVKMPPVLAGMDRSEALAWVSRLFDSAKAGAHVWSDLLLIKRFLTACSPTGSRETISGYRREIKNLVRWRNRHHGDLNLREIDPGLMQDWVDELRSQVEAGLIKPRTFNRRVAAISSLYRWASEPCRSSVTGIPRNPVPARALLKAPKTTRGLSEEQLALVLAEITRSGSRRDYVLIRGAFLLGCRVSELAQLKWADIQRLADGGQIHLLGKGAKARTVRVSAATVDLFESLSRQSDGEYLFPSPRRDGHLSRQAIGDICRKWGKRVGLHLHPHGLRHSHASISVQRGVNTFTLMATLGHASSATTTGYVRLNPSDSSSLRLG